jgi:hypothetical protein
VARIRTRRKAGRLQVAVVGRLTAADLRRLEDACSEAFASEPLSVDLQLGKVTAMDAAAVAFIERMVRRGATVGEQASLEGHGLKRGY